MSHAATLSPFPLSAVVEIDTESNLVRLAQQRDPHAFAALYRTHVGRVYALCLRMTADAPLAEELTQQAFIGAWEKLPRFRSESSFATWLHRLAINTVLMAGRARSRLGKRIVFTDDPAALETAPLARPSGARLDLEQAMATLPAQARAVFVLYEVEGWQHDEIAEKLGIAAGTSKAQLHRARNLLKEALR
jgi:RNA polymerase sigma-70 factor (ECF subfamily)